MKRPGYERQGLLGLDREARGDAGGELASCGVRSWYSAWAPKEAPECPQGSRPEPHQTQDPDLLCGEAAEAGRGGSDGQAPARAVAVLS